MLVYLVKRIINPKHVITIISYLTSKAYALQPTRTDIKIRSRVFISICSNAKVIDTQIKLSVINSL
jgi:hypothetical protein